MKNKYPRSFSSKIYPDFIKKSAILKLYPKPVKVFPNIGLKNKEETIQLDYSVLPYDKANEYIANIKSKLYDLIYVGKDFDFIKSNRDLYSSIKSFKSILYNFTGSEKLLTKTNDGYDFILPKNINVKGVKIPESRSFYDIFDMFKSQCDQLENINFPIFDRFCADDIIAKNLFIKRNKDIKVVFSSNSFDIATISMRGIKSCQSWNSSIATSLVGSIVDPYAAVIYITDGSNLKYGKKMLARAIVRLVVDGSAKKLFLERVYPYKIPKYKTDIVENIFIDYLKKHTNSKIPIVSYDGSSNHSNLLIPITEPIEKMYSMYYNKEIYNIDDILSYRDSNIHYQTVNGFFDPSKIKL